VTPSRTAIARPTATRHSAAPRRRALPLDSTQPEAGATPSHARFPGARALEVVPVLLRTRTTERPPPDSASTRLPDRAQPDDRERPVHRPPPTRQDGGGRETPQAASPTRRTTPPYVDCSGALAPPPAPDQAACPEPSPSGLSQTSAPTPSPTLPTPAPSLLPRHCAPYHFSAPTHPASRPHTPVLPNPPSPRSLGGNSATSSSSTTSTR